MKATFLFKFINASKEDSGVVIFFSFYNEK